MAKWIFSDGTVMESGGNVNGKSAIANYLREQIDAARGGERVFVPVAPHPGGALPLDPDKDFYLNMLAYQWNVIGGQPVRFTTDYEEGDDIPEEARKLRDRQARGYVPGRIY